MNTTGSVLFVRAESADGRGLEALEEQFDVVVAEGPVDAMKRLSTEPLAPDCLVTPASPGEIALETFLSEVSRTAPDVATVAVGELPTDTGDAVVLTELDAYVPPGREAVLGDRVRRLLDERRVRRAIAAHRRLERTVESIAVEVAASSERRAVELAVHDHLIGGAGYRHAWIASRTDRGELEVSVPVDGRLDPEQLGDLVGDGDPAFVSRAVETGHVVRTEGHVSTRSAAAAAPATAGDGGDRTRTLESAAVPFVHDGTVWGVGLVATERSDAFGGAERELLSDLGVVVGHALWALESAGPEPGSDLGRGMENLVHDLRNPLGIARAHLEIASEDGEVESLDGVVSALDRIGSTIDRVAASGAGVPSAETAPDDLDSAAAAAWELIEEPSASLTVVDSVAIVADRDLLVRLLANLFQNAVDHGGRDVTVRVGTVPGGFFVEDDGPGIPEPARTSVFERGFSTSDDGLGIGLSIVDDVAGAHGWTVSVTDAESGGARIEVTGVEQVEENV